MTSQVTKVKGIPLDLSGTIYVVPPLSLGALEQLQDGLRSFSGDVNDPAQVALIVDVGHAALKRNYPELTRAEVADLIGLENMTEVFEAVMDVSGLKRRAREAAGEPGEATRGELDFGQVIAHVCASTGWTWDYVAENIDLVRLAALNEYWSDHPPVHAMVAAYFGIKPNPTPADLENQDFSGLFALGTCVEGPVI